MCQCLIVPADILKKFSMDESLSETERQRFASMVDFEKQWRQVRALMSPAMSTARNSFSANVTMAIKPSVMVYDCATSTSLPGALISKPGTSADPTAKAVFDETTAVADFYSKIFGRNSMA